MDLAEVTVVEAVWVLDFGEALLPGLMLVWEEEDCRGAGTFSVEQRAYPGRGRQCGQGKHPIPLTECQLPFLEQHLSLHR